METSYIKALEARSRWLRWTKEEAPGVWTRLDKEIGLPSTWRNAYPFYLDVLENGDTFFMNNRFCDLVDHARKTVPDDLAFDPEWMQSKQGWLFLSDPFEVPELEENKEITEEEKDRVKKSLRVAAIGWRQLPAGVITANGLDPTSPGRKILEGSYQFVCFQSREAIDPNKEGYLCWSWFMLCPGDKLVDRIHEYEKTATDGFGAYANSRETDEMHEMRWIFSAFYLMAQKLAVSVKHETDRHTRRRNERDKTPVTPFIKVITLRRLEEDKKRQGANRGEIEWNWCWAVRGHWRNQYYPSTDEHKPVFVESYVKGDMSKPLKPEGVRVFVAGR